MFVPAPQQPATRAEFMTQKDSETKMATDMFPVKENSNPEPTPAEMISRSMNIASLEAEIGNSLQAYAKLPRNKIVTARTKEYAYASYMDAWRRKVERVGNLNFPAEAKRRNLNGDLILDVIVNIDGTIANIEVLRSSGHKILDDAAMRIVHLAAPYAPFTDEMKKETDVLHIIRTWRFRQGETLEAR
jgi:protein TonB